MSDLRFDLATFVNLAILAAATWGGIAGFYYALRSDIRSLNERDDRQAKQLDDHELRIRVLERIPPR